MTTRRNVLLGLAGASVAQARSAFAKGGTLTAADVHPNGYPTVEAVKWMSERIEAATDGRLRIRVFFAGQLGRESDTVDLARFGALDITRVNFAPLNNPFPGTRIFSLPYVFDSVAHMRRAADSQIGRKVLDAFARRDVIGLAIYDAGSRCFYNVSRAVREPADLNGLKVRVPPSDIFIRLARALGANPTPLPFGEVYSALQTGLIDGAENNWRTLHSSRQFEVAKHWAQTEHSYSPEALLMSRRTFDALSAADRDIILDAATQSVAHMRMLWDRMEEESRQFVIKAGVAVTDVDRGAFHAAARPVLEAHLKDPELQRLYEDIRALA